MSSSRIFNDQTVTLNQTVTALSDFNGDGKSDILWQNTGGPVNVSLMNGTSVSSSAQVSSNSDPTWHIVASGDFNGDGDSDLLWQNALGQINMSLMNGTTVSSSATIASPGTAWKVVAIGDFNGDGDSDILVQNSSSGQVDMWLMNGTTIELQHPDWQQHRYELAYRGDRRFQRRRQGCDMIWQNAAGQVNMSLMNGTTVSSSAQISSNSDPAWKDCRHRRSQRRRQRAIFSGRTAIPARINMSLMNGTTVSSSTTIFPAPAPPGG